MIFENWLIAASMIRIDILLCIDKLVGISQVTALVSTSLKKKKKKKVFWFSLRLFLVGESDMKHNAVFLAWCEN